MIEKTSKKLILAILNGGYMSKYHKDEDINKFLKDIENEARMLHDYFIKMIEEYQMIDLFIIIWEKFRKHINGL